MRLSRNGFLGAMMAIGLGLSLAGCSSKNSESATSASTAAAGPTTTVLDQKAAGEAMARLLQYVSDGQYGREWDELHPLQQAFVPKALFVRCAAERLAGIDVTDIKVKETFLERTDVPGTDVMDAQSVAVTIAYVAQAGERKEPSTDTFHAYYVDGRWRWAVNDDVPYKNGECPA